jgi:hypothetical protein
MLLNITFCLFVETDSHYGSQIGPNINPHASAFPNTGIIVMYLHAQLERF